MSFDLFLHCFESGDSAPANREAALDVLRRHSDASANKYGFYYVEFQDGSHVEFSAKGLEADTRFSGCAFHLRSFSQAVITFVYEVAVAGGMVIFNAQGDGSAESPVAVLVEQSHAEHLPEGLGYTPRFVESAEALAGVLGADMTEWRAYRDHVVGGGSNLS